MADSYISFIDLFGTVLPVVRTQMYFAAKKTRKRAERYSALAGKEKAFSTFRLICLKRRGAGIACWDMKKTVLLLLAFVAVNLGAVVVAQEDISKLDKNFAVEKLGNIDVAYRDALSEPFVLEGFPWHEKGRKLFRLPHSTKPDDISGGVYSLASHTAGGVVRFRTDSPYIVLRFPRLNYITLILRLQHFHARQKGFTVVFPLYGAASAYLEVKRTFSDMRIRSYFHKTAYAIRSFLRKWIPLDSAYIHLRVRYRAI